MMYLGGVLCLLFAQDLKVPAEVKGEVASFVTIVAETEGKSVKFVPLDGGLSVFPQGLLSNPKATVVTSAFPGTYRLLAYTAKDGVPSDPQFTRVIIGQPGPAPQPVNPVNPPQPVNPVQPPSPAPIPVEGFRVLLVFDPKAQTSLTAAQNSILFGADVRGYLNSKTAIAANGAREWRLWPVGTDNSGEAKYWQDVMARPRQSLPWVVISNGKAGYEGPLPATVEDMLRLLKTYGGE